MLAALKGRASFKADTIGSLEELTSSNSIAYSVSVEFEGGSGGTWSGYQTESDAFANVLHIASVSCLLYTSDAADE